MANVYRFVYLFECSRGPILRVKTVGTAGGQRDFGARAGTASVCEELLSNTPPCPSYKKAPLAEKKRAIYHRQAHAATLRPRAPSVWLWKWQVEDATVLAYPLKPTAGYADRGRAKIRCLRGSGEDGEPEHLI
jgi:hypothetical protein